MKRLLIFAITSLYLLLTSHSVVAGNRPGVLTVSFGDAYYIFANKRHIDNVWMPNLALAYNFDRHWAIEGSAGLINSYVNPPVSTSVTKNHGFLYLANGLYRFGSYYRFEPYVSMGLGVLALSPNFTSAPQQGNVNLGLGTQFFATPDIAFRAEAKDLYTITGGKNDVMLNIGMSFLFDGCMKCCL